MRKCLFLFVISGLFVYGLSMPIITADAYLEFTIPQRVEIALSTAVVDLGTPHGTGQLYFEQIDAVQVDFRCNIPSDWEVRISAADFRDGNRRIPISRLQWRTGLGSYQNMPPSGNYAVIARGRDYARTQRGLKQSKSVSYRLELKGDEWGGTYSAPITYTLFVP